MILTRKDLRNWRRHVVASESDSLPLARADHLAGKQAHLLPRPYQSVLGEGQYRASNGGVGETRPRREFVGGLCSLGFDESLQNSGLTLAYIYQTRRVSRRQFSLESGSELYLIWSVSETDARELSVLVRESHDVRAIGLGSSRCP